MPKKAEELSAVAVKNLTTKGLYAVGGVAGLHLQVSNAKARSWILRTKVGERRRDIGLGGYPDIGLSLARDKAREIKDLIRQGIDPVEQRQQSRQALIQSQLCNLSFADVARQAHSVKNQEFKNPKHAAQWISTLETYAFPIIGKLSIDAITPNDVLAVLEPIWSTKTETATRVRQRIASVFDHALASGIRTNPNPAAWKGCLEPLLPSPQKLKKRQGKANVHFPALAITEMNRFIQLLQSRKGNGAKALEFTILCTARTGMVLGATWDEINFEAKTWHLSAERMKADLSHTVPLSKQAIALLKQQHTIRTNHLVFTSDKGVELSDATLIAVIKRLHEIELENNQTGFIDTAMNNRRVTTHGFRSTFKDWARKSRIYPDEWSELALAHVSSDQTRSAYARDQLINERAEMMQDWADFISPS